MPHTISKQFSKANRNYKSVLSGALLVSLLCSVSGTAMATVTCQNTSIASGTDCAYSPADVRVPTEDATTISNKKTSVSGGSTTTMTGTITFQAGETGFGGEMPIANLDDDDPDAIMEITPEAGLPTDPATLFGMPVTHMDLRAGSVTYTDPVTLETFTIPVYNNVDITAGSLQVQRVETFYGVDQDQYINLRLGEVDATGGTLTVETNFQNTSGVLNNAHIAAKQSTLFLAEGDGSAQSRIIWNVAGPVNLNMYAAATGEDAEMTTTQMVSQWPYTVNVTLTDNSVDPPVVTVVPHTINDFSEYTAFNTTLQGYISSGLLPPSETLYTNYMQEARNLKSVQIKYKQQVEDPFTDDKVYLPNGAKAILRATGEGASVEMAVGTQINAGGMTGVLFADGGASALNEGTINIEFGSGINVSTSALGTVRSSGINSNVINVGYRASGANVSNSDFTNQTDGIINVSVSDDVFESYGVVASAGSVVNNEGTINVGVNAAGILNGSSFGAIVNDSEFNNSGTIYMGRAAQSTPGEVVAETNTQAADPMAAIDVRGDSKIVNSGNITIGSLSDGIDGIRIIDARNAEVIHAGVIDILGQTSRGRLNTAVTVNNSGVRTDVGGVVTNSITIAQGSQINLMGTNATGLYVLSDDAGDESYVSMLGDIFIEGDRHPINNTRNHGIWVIGENGGKNIVDVKGTVTMRGDGAIAVHARGDSTINVVDGGNVIFESGTDQVGYFLVGPEAVIRVIRNDLAVSTERSTLFRIEGGATFDGRDYHVTVSGKESIGVLGVSDNTLIDIENGRYDVTGEGAVAVKVTGGSQAWIYNDAEINLLGKGSRGIIADGNEYNIVGDLVNPPNKASTQANSTTDLTAYAEDVVGFTVMNNATLNYSSSDRMFPSPISSPFNPGQRLLTRLYGDNSVAFKGENTSHFNIDNINLIVNGWIFNTNNGTHTIDLKNMTALGASGFLKNVTDVGQPVSTANVKMQNTQVQGIVTTDASSFTNIEMDPASQWYGAGGSNLTNLTNNGFVAFSAFDGDIVTRSATWDGVFKNIEITDDYIGGTGSAISMHVFLDDGTDPTKTDRLILGNSYGYSQLFIQNGGGYGKKTVDDGIEIITVLGTSDAVFELGRRLFAGAYEYELFKGDINGVNGNWYLRSTGFRPEVPIYSAANNFVARMGQSTIGTYRERHGYNNSVKSKPRAWGRAYGSYNNSKQKRVDPIVDTSNFFKHGSSYSSRMAGIQTGMDLLRRGGEGTAFDAAGVYVAVGQGVGDVNHVINEKAGKIHQNAYNVGGYWTRTGERENWYVDAVAQVSYYNLDTTTAQGLTGGSHAMGYAGSIELGYDLPLNTAKTWSIEPQAQVIYQRTGVRDVTDYAGHIRFDAVNNIYTRLGARLITSQQWGEMEHPFKAWVRADVWRDVSPKTYTKFSALDDTPSVQIKNKPVGTWGTVGLGVAGHLNNTVSIFASSDYSHNISHEDDRGWNGRVGLNIQW